MLPIQEFIAAARSGDEDGVLRAIAEHESYVRRMVRIRLRRSTAARFADSMDVWQSAIRRLFQMVREGTIDPNEDHDVRDVLVRIALNRCVDHQRKAKRHRGSLPSGSRLIDPKQSSQSVLESNEEVEHLLGRLSEPNQSLLKRRLNGESWEEIGRGLGQNPDAVRMRLTRALSRVRKD